jgi:hypothetical protein
LADPVLCGTGHLGSYLAPVIITSFFRPLFLEILHLLDEFQSILGAEKLIDFSVMNILQRVVFLGELGELGCFLL